MAADYRWTIGGDAKLSHVKRIDSGSTGAVHELLSDGTKSIARKIMGPGVDMNGDGIRNELRAVIKLCKADTHKNIIHVYGHGVLPDSDYYYIDMELCDQNLGTYILENSPIAVVEICRIMQDIISGVAYIHSHNEVHRDLKPRNSTSALKSVLTKVLLSKGGIWKVADYGLTSEGTSRRAHTKENSRGTEGYRAPELISQDGEKWTYTNKVDIFAIGCIFHELVTSQKAFANDCVIHQTYSAGEPHTALMETLSIFSNSAALHLFPSQRSLATKMVLKMLEIDPSERPRAATLCHEFSETEKWIPTTPDDESPRNSEFQCPSSNYVSQLPEDSSQLSSHSSIGHPGPVAEKSLDLQSRPPEAESQADQHQYPEDSNPSRPFRLSEPPQISTNSSLSAEVKHNDLMEVLFAFVLTLAIISVFYAVHEYGPFISPERFNASSTMSGSRLAFDAQDWCSLFGQGCVPEPWAKRTHCSAIRNIVGSSDEEWGLAKTVEKRVKELETSSDVFLNHSMIMDYIFNVEQGFGPRFTRFIFQRFSRDATTFGKTLINLSMDGGDTMGLIFSLYTDLHTGIAELVTGESTEKQVIDQRIKMLETIHQKLHNLETSASNSLSVGWEASRFALSACKDLHSEKLRLFDLNATYRIDKEALWVEKKQTFADDYHQSLEAAKRNLFTLEEDIRKFRDRVSCSITTEL